MYILNSVYLKGSAARLHFQKCRSILGLPSNIHFNYRGVWCIGVK